MQETWVQFLGQEDPLEKEMATHSSILAWRIPWTEPWRATVHQVTRVGHDLVTKPPSSSFSLALFMRPCCRVCVCVCVCVCVLVIQLYPTLCNPMGFLCPGDFPGKNIEVGCHALFQGIFLIQGLNPCLLRVSCIADEFFIAGPMGEPPAGTFCIAKGTILNIL